MTIAALLVDLDGTLVDTSRANYEAYAAALRTAGVTVTRAAFDEVAAGRNWRQFLPGLLAAHGSEADPAAIAALKTELYPGKLGFSLVNTPLVALIAAGRPGWKTALVTTASGPNAAAVLAHHRLEDLFDLVVTGSDVSRHKPDPEAYVAAAAKLGSSPDQCLIVEDSDIGVAAAAAFGAPCLRVSFPM